MAAVIPLYRLPVFSIVNPPSPDVEFNEGAVFLVDKPAGWSSFKVVKTLRRFINLQKVGHAGTLDPLATGLLILCCGKATRTISEIQKKPKTYRAEITLGASTPSFDSEEKISQTAPFRHITLEALQNVLSKNFTGEIWQKPPMYSAIKQNGKRLYELARQGKVVKRKPRKIMIHNTHILSFDLPHLTLYIKCSSGTYVRSIANDLGRQLHTLAYLSGLKRLTIGEYDLKDALTIGDFELIFSTV
jgi:tRNA pseudouridine55 synthase